MNANNIFSIAISAGLYAFSAWVFYSYVKFVFEKLAPKLTSGNLDFKFIVSFLAGSLMLLGLLTIGPPKLAEALKSGWEQFIPIMSEAMQMVINDVDDIMSGNTPVYIPSQDPVQPSSYLPQPAPTAVGVHTTGGLGNGDVPIPEMARPDINGGIDTSTDQAGGGAPTEWTPDMAPPLP